MLFGVWLAAKKPPRDVLLKPIVIQLEALMATGIHFIGNDGIVFIESMSSDEFILGSRLSFNIRIQQAIFDFPARAHFLNIVQYNGYNGCGDCCIKGA